MRNKFETSSITTHLHLIMMELLEEVVGVDGFIISKLQVFKSSNPRTRQTSKHFVN